MQDFLSVQGGSILQKGARAQVRNVLSPVPRLVFSKYHFAVLGISPFKFTLQNVPIVALKPKRQKSFKYHYLYDAISVSSQAFKVQTPWKIL